MNGNVAAVGRLVELGADVNRKGTFGGPDHGKGVTALHLAAQNGQLAAVRALVEAGADPAITDDIYGGPAAGWATQGGQPAVVEYLEAL